MGSLSIIVKALFAAERVFLINGREVFLYGVIGDLRTGALIRPVPLLRLQPRLLFMGNQLQRPSAISAECSEHKVGCVPFAVTEQLLFAAQNREPRVIGRTVSEAAEQVVHLGVNRPVAPCLAGLAEHKLP